MTKTPNTKKPKGKEKEMTRQKIGPKKARVGEEENEHREKLKQRRNRELRAWWEKKHKIWII